MKSGWIKFDREWLNHWLYNENRPRTKREAWEDILLLTNYSEQKVLIGNEIFDCKRGQSLRSLENWSKQFKWTKSKVKRFFDLLSKEGLITTENLYKTTRVTICNYETYQDKRNEDETQPKRSRNLYKTQMNANKNEKKNKNENDEKELIELNIFKKMEENGNIYIPKI